MVWRSNDVLRFSESVLNGDGDEDGFHQYVDVDVTTGERIAEEPYTDRLQIYHDKPSTGREPPRAENPWFRTEDNRVYWRDGDTALTYKRDSRHSTSGYGLTAWSPTGRFLARADDRDDPPQRIHDGERQTTIRLPDGAGVFVWLPTTD